jgi:hypothetical protein
MNQNLKFRIYNLRLITLVKTETQGIYNFTLLTSNLKLHR